MSGTQSQLTELIDQLAIEKTFSLDGVDVIKKLKDRALALEQSLKEANLEISKLEQIKSDGAKTISDQRQMIEGIAARERAVSEREAKITNLERDAAVAVARAHAFEQSLKIVFAPNIVRETVLGFTGRSQPNGVYSNDNENKGTSRVEGYAQEGAPDSAGGTQQPKATL